MFSYKYDDVFGPTASQQLIYEMQVHSKIDHAFKGNNTGVIVYGPPQSWKTYTMFGNPNKLNNIETQGIASRTINDCFDTAAHLTRHQIVVTVQMLQIFYENNTEKMRVYIYIYINK